uniref:Uncharacterized protein n=1 Tax=Oryza punctata TaxID=4537 RepID=A0A0E0KWS8_ORYPU
MKRSDAPAFPTPSFPIPHSPTRQWRLQVKRSPQAAIRSADSDAEASRRTPRRPRRPAITIFRKPEFDWYCCAKINRKESDIREQVSEEKVCEGEASSLLGGDSFLGVCSPKKLFQSEPGGDSFLGVCFPIKVSLSEPKF